MARILHTEASPGWGGQEKRILTEAEGMRERGHEVLFAAQPHGQFIERARERDFTVYPVAFTKGRIPVTVWQMARILRKEAIDIVNTHSSLDAWCAGAAARLSRRPVIRTRHLSTKVRPGLNSVALYNWLADYVVTTCEEVVIPLASQAKLPRNRCVSIPTGIDPSGVMVDPQEVEAWRESLGVKPDDVLVGTLCILRWWKGITDLLQAADILRENPQIKWVVVGDGVSKEYFLEEWRKLGLENHVIFAGYMEKPAVALAAMDIFTLLSTGHEGVSQASLQASLCGKPIVATPTGGLCEVCIDGETGIQVPVNAPKKVAEAVEALAADPELRAEMGIKARNLVLERFTYQHMLDRMEALYQRLGRSERVG